MSLPTDKKQRKEMPIARGVLDYFPDAVAAVANVSYVGNQQHNPGEEMHWARGKSDDHRDCIARHLIEYGTVDDDGVRHSAKLAWRALAACQLDIERASKGNDNCRDGRSLGEQQRVSIVPCISNGPTVAEKLPRETPDIKAIRDNDWVFLVRTGCPASIAKAIVGGITYTTESRDRTSYLYIAGPMRGYPQFNFPAFDATRDRWIGWNRISPADIDRASGFSPDTPQEKASDQREFIFRDFHALNLIAHCKGRKAIVTLDGWEKSKGATAEYHLAKWFGFETFDQFGGKI